MNFIFKKNEVETRMLAIFVAQLVKEAVVFKVREDEYEVSIELTGGF